MARPKKATQAESLESNQPDVQERNYGKTVILEHDLFKLLPAKMKKNGGYNPDRPIWVEHEHTHHFHTIDSKGAKQKVSSPIGGHAHLITVKETGGVPEIISVSGPVKKGLKRIRGTGRLETVWIPLKDDNHVHEALYVGSEKIRPAKLNPEFAKFSVENRQQIRPPASNPNLDKEFVS